MAGKLKKRVGSEELTFEVFELELDDEDRQRLSDDPRGFITGLLEEENLEVNALLLDSDERIKGPEGTATATHPLPPSVWHCTSPPEHKSKWITIVHEGGEEEVPID